jgi:hypothetical protein
MHACVLKQKREVSFKELFFIYIKWCEVSIGEEGVISLLNSEVAI